MPIAYGYCRASTGKQVLTFEVQRSQIERYYEHRLKPEGYEGGGFFEDKSTSGAMPFTEREQGLRLWVTAQPGDAIVWSKMDRAFRSVRDGANTLHMLKTKGIGIHSIDINLDTDTALGGFVCHLLMLLGELERSWVSTRTREAKAARRERGEFVNCGAPAGWKRAGKKVNILAPDMTERTVIDSCYSRFLSGVAIDELAFDLFHRKKQIRASGARFHIDFLNYALHSKALGYPVEYHHVTHNELMKSPEMKTGKGRVAIIARLRILEEKARVRLQQSREALRDEL